MDATPFEPDWGGASWYGTTSGTYWTLNPKEYADPRKHGPEYQARARRTSRGRSAGDADGRAVDVGSGCAMGSQGTEAADADVGTSPTVVTRRHGGSRRTGRAIEVRTDAHDHLVVGVHIRNDSGTARRLAARSAGTNDEPGRPTGPPPAYSGTPDGAAYGTPASDPPDIGRALSELGRALLDDRTGGTRGRIVRAVVGWLPIAFGIGWLAGEVDGVRPVRGDLRRRNAAVRRRPPDRDARRSCSAIPILASVTTMATITLLVVASFVALVLSATGSAADDGSRRVALGSVLLISWLAGLVVAGARRVRSATPSVPPARPVS